MVRSIASGRRTTCRYAGVVCGDLCQVLRWAAHKRNSIGGAAWSWANSSLRLGQRVADLAGLLGIAPAIVVFHEARCRGSDRVEVLPAERDGSVEGQIVLVDGPMSTLRSAGRLGAYAWSSAPASGGSCFSALRRRSMR
jgi:hypothetical protein